MVAILGGFFLLCMWLTIIAVGLEAGGAFAFFATLLLIAFVVVVGGVVISILGFLWKVIFPDF
ncbi:MAG: hypothetical protein HFJ27_06690 [Clostridia bacterium]|nr:hypothetical protein [Clostridia bacterium]